MSQSKFLTWAGLVIACGGAVVGVLVNKHVGGEPVILLGAIISAIGKALGDRS